MGSTTHSVSGPQRGARGRLPPFTIGGIVENVIEIDGLQKRYGDVLAVRDVTLQVARGESFGYLGPNGAGKTTTIRCLLGFIRPSAGTMRIFGMDVATHLSEILARTGYLPGEFGLWPSMTGRAVLDYLGTLHPAEPRARAALCERFDLSDDDLDREVRFYSRGMKQKLGLIQAFQHEPDLVILDEPTEGLDPVMQERVIGLLREHTARGGTILLTSHILSEVELATDRVGIIKGGHIVRAGAARDLTGERVRRCTLTLRAPAPGLLDGLDGVSDVAGEAMHLTFEHRGDMRPLLGRIAGADVVEFLAEPESLADAFFEIFREER